MLGYHIPSPQTVTLHSMNPGDDVELVALGIGQGHPLHTRLVVVADARRAEGDDMLDIGSSIRRRKIDVKSILGLFAFVQIVRFTGM